MVDKNNRLTGTLSPELAEKYKEFLASEGIKSDAEFIKIALDCLCSSLGGIKVNDELSKKIDQVCQIEGKSSETVVIEAIDRSVSYALSLSSKTKSVDFESMTLDELNKWVTEDNSRRTTPGLLAWRCRKIVQEIMFHNESITSKSDYRKITPSAIVAEARDRGLTLNHRKISDWLSEPSNQKWINDHANKVLATLSTDD